jgi:hypothetical protein
VSPKPGVGRRQADAQKDLAALNKDLAWEMSKAAVDVAGIIDPTPISDGISAAMSLAEGDLVGAGLSLVSMVPYVGDALGKTAKGTRAAAKIAKLQKKIAAVTAELEALKKLEKAKDAAARAAKQAKKAPKKKPKPCSPCKSKVTPGKRPPKRPAKSPFYSVVFEAKLRPKKHYPNVSRAKHFQEGNRQLHQTLKKDPALAKKMEELYPGINKWVEPGPRGAHSRQPPKGLTWHHHPDRKGVLQLIPRAQHEAKGPIQQSLHPGKRGGMENWGGGGKK